jgi:hypothetical protein
MADFGIFRGFGDKLFQGQLPIKLGLIGSQDFGFDTDAQAFFNRVTTSGGTLSESEKNATDTLVKQMKADGIWTKMKAIYPMVGASAAACAQNLKSSSFTGTFTSGWTFASTGATPNGTSAYFDTQFNVLSEVSSNNQGSFGIYSRSDRTGADRQQGVIESGVGFVLFILRNLQNNTQNFINSTTATSIANNDTRGFYQMTRTSSTNTFHAKNSTISTVSLTATGRPNFNFYFGARNNFNSAAILFDTIEMAFGYLASDSLSTTDLSNYNTAVQAFQTTLSRNV